MTVAEAIRARRSIRKYLPDPVADEDLKVILEAARLAPSGCNAQPWRFVIVRDPGLKAKIAAEAMLLPANERMCSEAPVVLVCLAMVDAHCDIPDRVVDLFAGNPAMGSPELAETTGRLLKSRFDAMEAGQRAAYMAQNTGIALTQMMLQATELGYGMCWLGAFDREAMRGLLDLPEEAMVVAVTPLGRPAERPAERPRLSLDEIVFVDGFTKPLGV